MQKWILPTISEVLYLGEKSTGEKCYPLEEGKLHNEDKFLSPETGKLKSHTDALFIQAEGKWRAAIAALEQLLIQFDSNSLPLAAPGLVFTGPAPVLSHQALSELPTWIFRPEPLNPSGKQFQLPPAVTSKIQPSSCAATSSNTSSILTLLPADPLADEQFCLVLTAKFSLVMVLGNDITGSPAFLFSFDPEVVEQAWRSLQRRIAISAPHLVNQLEPLVKQYYPVAPDYRTVTKFTCLLLKHLPEASSFPAISVRPTGTRESYSLPITINSPPRPDIELIQAFAHEIRTPLTTIRTHTRLLLKRRELPHDISNRLKIIDRECTEQIDRMELLFQAAELQSTAKHSNTQLTTTSLSQVLQQSIPRWQSSANRRNLTLDVALPQYLPTVVSDPMMLDRVLTGLIEKFTRSLPPGSHIQVRVIPAGDQLKLQLLPQAQLPEGDAPTEPFLAPTRGKSIGPLLTFEPETGNISLNLAATKHLFQAIGGKLIVRQRPHQGEVLTIFLPLDVTKVGLDLKPQLATGH